MGTTYGIDIRVFESRRLKPSKCSTRRQSLNVSKPEASTFGVPNAIKSTISRGPEIKKVTQLSFSKLETQLAVAIAEKVSTVHGNGQGALGKPISF